MFFVPAVASLLTFPPAIPFGGFGFIGKAVEKVGWDPGLVTQPIRA